MEEMGRMELEKQIYELMIKGLDLDEERIQALQYDTLFFDIGDGQENLGLDSLDLLDLITIIYETWEIEVPSEDMKKLYSIHATADYIRNFEKG